MRNPKLFNQPKFDVSILKRWLKDEENIRASAKRICADRRRTAVERQKVGKYPEMELKLVAHIKNYRALGLPVDVHVLKCEARSIFHELHPSKYPKVDLDNYDPADVAKGAYPLEFSNRWKINFMERNNLSHRKIGSKINKKGRTPEMMIEVEKYHLDCRIFQLSPSPPGYIRDPVYGLISKKHGYSHDQVRIYDISCTDGCVNMNGSQIMALLRQTGTPDNRQCQ